MTRWFDYFCGWRLVVEPRAGYARLVKVRRDLDAVPPGPPGRSGPAPFDRRRYVLFCVVAAELLADAGDHDRAAGRPGRPGDRRRPGAGRRWTPPAAPNAWPSSTSSDCSSTSACVDVLDGATESLRRPPRRRRCSTGWTPPWLVRLLAAPNGPSRLPPRRLTDAEATKLGRAGSTLIAAGSPNRRYGDADDGFHGLRRAAQPVAAACGVSAAGRRPGGLPGRSDRRPSLATSPRRPAGRLLRRAAERRRFRRWRNGPRATSSSIPTASRPTRGFPTTRATPRSPRCSCSTGFRPRRRVDRRTARRRRRSAAAPAALVGEELPVRRRAAPARADAV